MTSELRVDNLKGSTTGGSINVLGEGTSATTNLQQGLAKAWARHDGSSNSISTFNVSSFTDDATAGNTTVFFTSNMANEDYVGVASANQNTGDIGDRFAAVSNFFAGSVDTFAFDGTTRTDVQSSIIVMGDLA